MALLFSIVLFDFCKKNKHKVIVESMGRLSLECGILAKAIRLHDIYFHEHVGLNSFKKQYS